MPGKRKILGLDIGRTTVKAVWAVGRGPAVEIARTETLRLPADTADRQAVIAPWFAKLSAEGRTCALGLSGQGAMFQPLVLMEGDPRTPQQVATMERYRFNELAAEEMSFSFAPTEGAGGQRCVLLAMARPGLLDEAIGTARELGLQVVDLVPSAVALYNALALSQEDARGPVVYADVGHSGTELAVGTARGLLFARHFSVGGQAFTDAIARARKVSGVQAEGLKLAKGHLDSDDADLAQALRKTADLWVNELMACLAVYASVFSQPADRPVRLVLCGGGSQLPGFAPYVGAKLGLEIRVPASLSVGAAASVPPAYATAAGLALGALGLARTPLTLLPEVLRDEQVFRSQKPYWIAAGVVAALILGVSVAGGLRDSQRKQKQLNAQEASLAHRQKLVQEIEDLRGRTEALRSMADPVRNLLGNAARLRAILSAVALARDPSDWITLVCDAESYYNPPAASDAPPDRAAAEARRTGRNSRTSRDEEAQKASAPLDHVIIEGYTRAVNLSTVQKMIEALKQVEFVASADLLSDDKLVPREESEDGLRRNRARRFVIDVKLKAP
jgi:cell division ATPase FtsA